MQVSRSCGILMHPTSLPSRFGIGDLGPGTLEFLDFLGETGQGWWQLLPIGPIGDGNSPYQSPSSFAGNPFLLSPERMVEQGWLSADELGTTPDFPEDRVDYDSMGKFKGRLLRKAFAGFGQGDVAFREFLDSHSAWLDDYALFMAAKEAHGGRGWSEWPSDLATREPGALEHWRERLAEEVRFHSFVQYAFELQWNELRNECVRRKIRLIGDLPIFVSWDSADVWARPELFELDDHGRPTVVAGVPPDFFSEDGQRWGNPLYRWGAHQAEGFSWWIERMRGQFARVDLVRLDHFRAFEAYWEVPASAPTAAQGRWVSAPGEAFFEAVRSALGGLPLIAEDLGEITPAVEELRDRFELPGMKVLQFAFGNDPLAEQYLPYSYPRRCVVYTGTHDNDTTLGWFTAVDVESTQSPEEIAAERLFVLRFIGNDGAEIHWDLIRAAHASVGDLVVIPMQDVLGLDSRARMNRPGIGRGNWEWRATPNQIGDAAIRRRLGDLAAVYGRFNGEVPPALRPPRKPNVEDRHGDQGPAMPAFAGDRVGLE